VTAPFGTLIARARSFVRDEGASFIDDDDLGNWINEAYKDIASRLEILQREEAWHISGATPADRQNLPMPTAAGVGTYAITSLRLGLVDVQFVSDDVFNDWQDATSSPPTTIARVFNGQIELYPIPDDAQEYVLRFVYVPADLVQPNDLHVLPVQLERKLVEYAVSQANMKDGDYASADRWFLKYEQGLPQVTRGRETQMPGTMSFQPAPTYFEEDARSHRSSMG
jgi:hypothetical protein